jgi:hypothetical protein
MSGRCCVVTVRLLVIPTDTEAELEVLGEFPIIAGVEAFHVGVGSANELEVTNAVVFLIMNGLPNACAVVMVVAYGVNGQTQKAASVAPEERAHAPRLRRSGR